MDALRFLIDKEVDIFNPNDTEENDGLMASGRIVDIKEGWLILANPRSGEPDFVVNLRYVGMVAVREPLPVMEALPGGKIHRLPRPNSGRPGVEDDDEADDE
jgi:hypothetical protein